MSQGGSNKKVSNSLLALSSAAILAVYTAGYSRTRAAAERFTVQTEERRPPISVASVTPPPLASPDVVAPAAPAPSVPKREAAVRPATPSRPSPVVAEIPAVATAPAQAETAAPIPPPAAEPAPVVAEQKVEVKPETPAAAPATPPHPVWKDGTYTGWGYSRHGDIQASVVIEGGRIASATIAQCNTRYSCSVIDAIIPQPVQRQSPEVDYVSGATQSANAFYYAVFEALAKAK